MALILGTKIAEHDGCFALVKDGVPLFVYEEERFNRIKHGISCSADGLCEGLSDFGVDFRDIDFVTNYIDARLVEGRKPLLLDFFGAANRTQAEKRYERVAWSMSVYRNLLLAHGFEEEQIIDVRHHLAHCAGVFYPSPHHEAAILSIDGGGEAETVVLAHGVDERIMVLKSQPHPHSLGHFYLAATRWLGWEYGEEGKTMALASYGKPKFYDLLREAYIDIDEDGFFRYTLPVLADEAFERVLGPKRGTEELTQRHKDVAASVQAITNEVMVKLARTLKRLTGSRNLLIAGGVGLNSVANGEILKAGIFADVLPYPQANDTGTALGGALYVEYNELGRKRKNYWVMSHAYLGREIDVENVPLAAERHGLSYSREADIAAAAAERIAQGKVVGWVQGRAEIGPRALGNRSVLADPRRPEMKDLINAKVKNREAWRPFAPSVLAEDSALYFEAVQPLPYMIVVDEVKPEWRPKLQAIMHVDGTARVQTVTRESNPRYYDLLSALKARTGVGMVLNTSLNDRGEPLVQTVEQALRLYLRTDMDALVIGDYLFEQKPEQVTTKEFHPVHWNIRKLDTKSSLLVIALEGLGGFGEFFDAADERGHTVTPAVVDATEGARAIEAFGQLYGCTNIGPLHEVGDLHVSTMVGHDATVFLVPGLGSEFVFNEEIFSSSTFSMAKTMHDKLDTPVFWVDCNGGVTDMAPLFRMRDIVDRRERAETAADRRAGGGESAAIAASPASTALGVPDR